MEYCVLVMIRWVFLRWCLFVCCLEVEKIVELDLGGVEVCWRDVFGDFGDVIV